MDDETYAQAMKCMTRTDIYGILKKGYTIDEIYPSVFLAKNYIEQRYVYDYELGIHIYILDRGEYINHLLNDTNLYSRLVGDHIKWMLRSIGISRGMLSKKLHVSESTISRYMSGDQLPNSLMQARIASLCGYDINSYFSYIYR